MPSVKNGNTLLIKNPSINEFDSFNSCEIDPKKVERSPSGFVANTSLVFTKNKSPQGLKPGLQVSTCHESHTGVESEIKKNDKNIKKSPEYLKKQPRYIRACENEEWTLNLINKKTGESTFHCYKCKSWRHVGECSRYKGAQDYRRIKGAIEKLGDNWIYLVLTFDRSKSLKQSYRDIVKCWDKFRKRLERKYGKFKYITLIEQHKDGYPHVNVLIHNEILFKKYTDFGFNALRKEWFDFNVKDSGFGWKYWIENMRSKDAISGYFVKLVGQMAGEFAKPSQIPREAPKNFRRLRASRGLLEKVFKNEDFTGELLFRPVYIFNETMKKERENAFKDRLKLLNRNVEGVPSG